MSRLLGRLEEGFCAVALLATALILFVNVTLRHVFNASTSWAEELIKYLMIWITCIGGSICVRRGAHIRMDFLVGLFSLRGKRALDVVVYVASALFCGALTVYGFRMVLFTLRTGQVSPALKLPMWSVYSAIPLGGGLMAFRFFQKACSSEEDER